MLKKSHHTPKTTRGERVLAEVAQAAGLRDLRWHDATLAGTPDLAAPAERVALFFHGCFWHAHEHCSCARVPRTNRPFWERKFEANRARDRRVVAELERKGWRVIALWECGVLDHTVEELAEELRGLLDGGAVYGEIWSYERRPRWQLSC
ncbi:DNA mismatch endonuclease Vsr [Sabulicella glaciei]|uniref:Very short patch repair endonuclease n=1 Tax=Sabulicella glaciei TaxID=2984948 RepID=A0ABT3P239_9PROT|nr:DNA mismatch endonuclease Vsr [Roseococcus sp. MDT2-1-1]MCW8088253.1 very short patch repair endonuclease [Roseococcus sp. MDT2-1-1]